MPSSPTRRRPSSSKASPQPDVVTSSDEDENHDVSHEAKETPPPSSCFIAPQAPKKPKNPSKSRKNLDAIKKSVSFSPEEAPLPPLPPKRGSSKKSVEIQPPPSKKPKHQPVDELVDEELLAEVERGLQKAKEVLSKIAAACKVNIDNLSLTPEDDTLVELAKGVLKQKPFRSNMYSTYKSLVQTLSRVLRGLALQHGGIASKFNVWGLALWRHQWESGELEGDIVGCRCYHGDRMVRKENTVQLPVTSEGGQQALKEGRGIIKTTPGRWQKQVVEITQVNLGICSNDAMQRYPDCSPKSCGLSFTDLSKAAMAMKNFSGLMRKTFPNLTTGSKMLPIMTHCFCNYGSEKRLMGRQIPRMTPYSVTHLTGGDSSDMTGDADGDEEFWRKTPCVFVLQCCNPTTSKRGGVNPVTCDLKLSVVDLLYVLQTARSAWQEYTGEAPLLHLPLFKWTPQLCYRTSCLPSLEQDNSSDVFGTFSDSEEEERSDDEEDE